MRITKMDGEIWGTTGMDEVIEQDVENGGWILGDVFMMRGGMER
jgi:hypothetical protein